MRDDIRELQDTLAATQFACVPPGVQSTSDDIYSAVQRAYPELCDEDLRCDDVCADGADQPEWKHAVRRVQQQLGRHDNTRISPHDEYGMWRVERPKLFLVPVNDEWIDRFKRTVGTPVEPSDSATIPESIAPLLPARIWGSTAGPQTERYFTEMRPRDCLLFYRDGDFFAGGVVGQTLDDPEVGSWLWGNPESRFIFTTAEYYDWAPAITRIWDALDYNGTPRVQGFLRVSPDRLDNLYSDERSLETTLFGRTSGSSTQADTVESDTALGGRNVEDPERTTTVQDRILRDQALVTELKTLYDHTCQICGHRLQSGSGSGYSEVHHIRPLGDPHNGPDIPENVLVCCPNHHADFDNGMITVNPDTHILTHAYDDSISGNQLLIQAGHQIRPSFLEYHNEVIVNQTD
ncbi:hypothetical protein GLW36_16570 [Halorubrum terrestre]|uniref:HNH nuclease domain-containing protein n=1 Tax=Halorubrum distributum TaxID=29283 RepID=A0A6B1IIJ3_9EURY|nr:HNH endonuclease [Halorubrum terrestre]MYL18241.1 hypothetical protein [Halorubrum terrestre]